MTKKQMIQLAAEKPGMVVILVGGITAIVNERDAQNADARGVMFAYLYIHKGKVIAIPNGND